MRRKDGRGGEPFLAENGGRRPSVAAVDIGRLPPEGLRAATECLLTPEGTSREGLARKKEEGLKVIEQCSYCVGGTRQRLFVVQARTRE
jgi:hypothetical protein